MQSSNCLTVAHSTDVQQANDLARLQRVAGILRRPCCFLDIESTGLDPVNDRIVSLAFARLDPAERKPKAFYQVFDPCIPIPAAATKVHGISNEMVAGKPSFYDLAPKLLEWVRGCDFAGYNLRRFDLPMLVEHFSHASIDWSPDGAIIDVQAIFHKREPRTLEADVKRYAPDYEFKAHNALHDTYATIAVLAGQLQQYADIDSFEKLVTEATLDPSVADLAGKLKRDSEGHLVYNFGKAKGQRVLDDPSYAHWMISASFSEDTKRHLRSELAKLEQHHEEGEMFSWQTL